MSTTIRLRLVIRRHAVPEVKLVWPCVANDDLTVARLLALVNEVVPLESGDWGLEDYVVELYDGKGDSFELLHFQPVGKVLKEDDQVLIRSLSTDDLRRRKLSGRHQISDDGKHLIDGLAFGRPWLRAPRDRPALDLPPRKRARITHEEELDEDDNDGSYVDEGDQSEQLLLEDSVAPEMKEPGSVRLRVRFMDSDQLEEENEDEDLDDENDFQPIEEVHAESAVDEEDEDDAESSDEDDLDADLSDELRLLQEDNAIVEQTPAKEQETLLSGDDSQDPQALLPTQGFDVSWLDKITALRAAFPLTPVSTLQDEMNRNKDLRKTYEKLSEANKPVISYDEALERVLLGPGFSDALSLDQPADEEEDPEDRVLLLPGQAEPKDATRPLIQEIEEEPAPVSTPRVAQNQTSKALISEIPDEEEDTSSSSSSSDSDSDSDSEADSDVDMEKKSGSESDSDSNDPDDDSSDDSDFPAPTPSRPAKTTQEDSEDSDSSDSDSDSDSSSDSSGAEATKGAAESDSDDSSGSSSDSDSSSSESDSESEPEEISSKKQPQTKQPQPQPQPPANAEPKINGHTGKAAPEPPQEPRPPGTGLARTQKRNARKRDAKRLKAMQALEDTQSQPSVNGTASEEAELLARKRALLSAVSDEQEEDPSPPKDATTKETRPMIVEVEEETPAVTASQDAAPVEEEPVPAQRRHKVDMGAGRRLLLGALGLKNPKTKADEDKLRDSLMKNVKPLQNPRVQAQEAKANVDKPAEEQPDEDPEAWRKKISYRAVECCQDDVVLSEPPFPFVQRWDPQQQYGSIRKRKRASQNFNDESYYEEDSQQWNGDEEWNDNSQRKKKKNKKRKNKSGYDGEYDEEEPHEGSFGGTGADGDEDIVLNYDDIPTKHRPEESQFTDTDDLPSLPSDVSTLPSLVLSDMKPGMVATWKQLVMSKATNWQPEMVPMTGLILSISEDNCMHVLLAMRDREGNDKEYDEHTGQRIYAKFEAPDLDEDEEDDGRREIPWAEMSDPRLVQPAPPPAMLETSAKSIKLQAEQNKTVQNGNSTSDNKVSARTDPNETMAEELDTQKVRAEVEADLRGQETEEKPPGTDKSTSIPSGQQPPRLEFPASGNDSPISSFVQPPVPFGKFDSHLHQLQESMQASMSQLQSPLSRDSDKGKKDNEEGEKTGIDESDGAKDAKDSEGEPVPTVEGSWDAVIPDTIPSPELPPLPTKDDVVVDHRLLVVPSSAGSVRSGRQAPSVSGLDDLPEERIEESVEGGIVDDRHGRSASTQVTNESRPRSSSPFPSLEEIFHTARQTQSPFKFSQMSVPQFMKSEKKDGDYEEAMRKLDEGEESDRSPDRNKSLRSLLPNATQPESQKGSPLVRSIKSEGPKPEASEPRHAATPPASQKVKQESQFAIPEGSQVIELSSSPASVQYAEDYAQDSEDETYQDSPLPQGSGWVQKKHSEVNTRSRGKSLPATEAKKTTNVQSRTTRGQTSAPAARGVSTSAYSQIKGRRKTTRKF
ncbi:related to SRP40-suppressor of mutant AC40 of RNA polymerase I and III [Fusarium fujikuroi IMI 58289]|uniref:Related to SRP40-suppressor of mutant AC40 of RNA polymerase I and III n=1 Tax=Gibberella fujikuroi (strain CBS 195.34 / IMI 58289 / NRRL A-6831) TaxID=1279085 RepID=S0ELT2_GIBF5|nr:related to SRP40-suppressor of mutant AC40 of RNA polymerase I and III [Fusarium fujikuroi IMI 58289]KLP12153.1 SRP40-suppressor of mutant AC40 of RNA polymerase I and III [Fusarium fujikuroi]CCT73353.1 related to SRP40-suppressor of mutant AC40 of RNA polymerase I and III [Fusarium fujikuroi IMI 58289]SCO16778.1 related to SRP40-suppressor of mutant AC40 of RNA polymerase I and III [Fusarium fujikuroi]SCO56357.1 related to SRP40-suppressor of mutant AC40 of RNA polymerase I and III [Fusariu